MIKRVTLLLVSIILAGCVSDAYRYDPCTAGNQVACNLAQAQAAATVQAQDSIRVAEATRRSIDAETTKVSAYANGTKAANDAVAQSTRSAVEARSTAEAASISATKQSYDAAATATQRADNMQATADTRRIEATHQAMAAESTRTSLHYEATRAAVSIANDERQAEVTKNQKIQESQTAAARELASEVIGVIVIIGLATIVVLGCWYTMRALTTWLNNRASTVRSGKSDKPVMIFRLAGGKVRIVDPDRMIGPAMGPEMEHQPDDWKVLDRVTARDQLIDLYERMTLANQKPDHPSAAPRQLAPISAPPPLLDVARVFLPDAIDLPASLPSDRLVIGQGEEGPIGGTRRDIRGLIAAGAPRSGKSTLMRSLAYQAAQSGWRLYLADPMSNTFSPDLWNRVRALAYPVVENPDRLPDMIASIESECDRRSQLFREIAAGNLPPEDLEGYNAIAREQLAPLMFIADEFNTFANADDVIERLTDLARRGQKWGLLVVLAAHSWRSKDIPRATADLLQSRIVFRLNSREAARTILDNGPAAMVTHITQPGRAVVVLNGDSQQVQTYRVDPNRIMSLVSGDAPLSTPSQDGGSSIAPDPEPDEIEVIAEKIKPVWERSGSKSEMARAAGFTQYGGKMVGKINRAIDYLEQQFGSTSTSTSTSTA
jgi:hypothetical protein